MERVGDSAENTTLRIRSDVTIKTFLVFDILLCSEGLLHMFNFQNKPF